MNSSSPAQWTKFAPPFVRQHDDALIPYPARASAIMNPVYADDYDGSDPLGLLVWGPSRSGKTRLVWQCGRRVFEDGETLHCIDLAAVIEASECDAERQSAWLKTVTSFEYLIVDDIGSEPLTWASAALLRRLLDKAVTNSDPVIYATAQQAGKELLAIWCARTPALRPVAMACLGRLAELCRVEYLGP